MVSAVARGISFVSVSIKNLLLFLLFIAVILVLFFIPELLKMDWIKWPGFSFTRRQTQAVSVPEALSPLDEVIDRINRGYYSTTRSIETPQGPLNWEYLRSSETQADLNRAVATAKSLLTKYDRRTDQRTVRAALVQFIAGVELVQGEGAAIMSATEAATYLERRDLAVAAALRAPGVDRDDYVTWMNVSVIPQISSRRTSAIKQQLLPPFNPRLKIKRLNVAKADPSAPGKKPLTYFEMRGTVQGSEIKNMTLLHNGSYDGKIPFDRPTKEGIREFLLSRREAEGTWTIRVEDKIGNIYEKTYRFFPNIESFPRDRAVYQLRYDAEGFLQPDIDKLLTVREKIPGQESEKGFVTF